MKSSIKEFAGALVIASALATNAATAKTQADIHIALTNGNICQAIPHGPRGIPKSNLAMRSILEVHPRLNAELQGMFSGGKTTVPPGVFSDFMLRLPTLLDIKEGDTTVPERRKGYMHVSIGNVLYEVHYQIKNISAKNSPILDADGNIAMHFVHSAIAYIFGGLVCDPDQPTIPLKDNGGYNFF